VQNEGPSPPPDACPGGTAVAAFLSSVAPSFPDSEDDAPEAWPTSAESSRLSRFNISLSDSDGRSDFSPRVLFDRGEESTPEPAFVASSASAPACPCDSPAFPDSKDDEGSRYSSPCARRKRFGSNTERLRGRARVYRNRSRNRRRCRGTSRRGGRDGGVGRQSPRIRNIRKKFESDHKERQLVQNFVDDGNICVYVRQAGRVCRHDEYNYLTTMKAIGDGHFQAIAKVLPRTVNCDGAEGNVGGGGGGDGTVLE
jgi:hypothetical protein